MKKDKRIEKKTIHDNMMVIKRRLQTGGKTTFSERNWLIRQEKKLKKAKP